jgi:WD40 repeat protein
VRPLYAVATTAIGQNVVRIYDTDKATTGSGQEPRTEIGLARGDEVSCLVWQAGTSDGPKKRKRRESSASSLAGELVCGLKSGQIVVIEQASGEIVRTLEGHSAAVNGWAVDEQGREGWSCADDGKVRAWDTRTGEGSTYLPLSPILPLPPFKD